MYTRLKMITKCIQSLRRNHFSKQGNRQKERQRQKSYLKLGKMCVVFILVESWELNERERERKK